MTTPNNNIATNTIRTPLIPKTTMKYPTIKKPLIHIKLYKVPSTTITSTTHSFPTKSKISTHHKVQSNNQPQPIIKEIATIYQYTRQSNIKNKLIINNPNILPI